MCETIARTHPRQKISKDHRVQPFSAAVGKSVAGLTVPLCADHRQPFRYFDERCGEPICIDCVALSVSLDAAVARSRTELGSMATSTEQLVGNLDVALAEVTRC